MEGPGEPNNRDFPGLLGAEVGRDFPGRTGVGVGVGSGLVPPERFDFREGDLGSQ